MRDRLEKIRMETWLGIGSYAVTFIVLYRITSASVGEPIGAAMFAAFLSPGAAIVVYLAVRTIARFAIRAHKRLRPAEPEPVAPPMRVAPKPKGEVPEKRFRLARHGSIDPAYGKPKASEAERG